MGAGRVATAFAVFFSGLAVIVATVLVVYVFSYMADRLTCFNAAILTEEELEERRNASRVTIQSGLAGLLKDERNSIYRSFFEKGSFPYSKTPATSQDENDTSGNDEQVDVEAQETVNPVEILSSEDVQGETDTVDKESMQNGAEATTYQSIDPCMAIDDEHSPTCSICLNEYGKFFIISVVVGQEPYVTYT